MALKQNQLTTKGDLLEDMIRVAIIGGGVAGMSCALWLKQLGLSPEIIERKATLGGQLLDIDRTNRWVLGFQDLTSPQLAGQYSSHIDRENIAVQYNTQPVALERSQTEYRLILQKTDGSQTVSKFSCLVIASGVRVNGIEFFSKVPGTDSLFTTGLMGCFPIDHLNRLEYLRGKRVAIIGGGDNAHFTAHDVAMVAARTYLLMRSPPKAQTKIRKQVLEQVDQGRVIEYPQVAISAFRQTGEGIEIVLNSPGSDVTKIKVDMIFVRIGFSPNSEFLYKLDHLANIKKQSKGYIETDSCGRTSLASVYAIGDVASPKLQSVVTAMAEGAIAARTIAQDIDKTKVV